MSNNIRVYIGKNVYNDWDDEIFPGAEKTLHHVGEVHPVCRQEDSRNKTTYSFGTTIMHGQWENNLCHYNEGEHRILKIDGEYAICKPVKNGQ